MNYALNINLSTQFSDCNILVVFVFWIVHIWYSYQYDCGWFCLTVLLIMYIFMWCFLVAVPLTDRFEVGLRFSDYMLINVDDILFPVRNVVLG